VSLDELAEEGIFDEMSDRGLYDVMCGGGLFPLSQTARVRAAEAWRRRYPGRAPMVMTWQVRAHWLAQYIIKEAGESE